MLSRGVPCGCARTQKSDRRPVALDAVRAEEQQVWDSERTIDDWLDEANTWSDNPVGAFDFPLRWRLRDLCDSYGFRLRNLTEPGVLMWDRPAQAVTFVENHDVVRDSPIINDKLLAYALS